MAEAGGLRSGIERGGSAPTGGARGRDVVGIAGATADVVGRDDCVPLSPRPAVGGGNEPLRALSAIDDMAVFDVCG
jgi:hypothetical protein